MPACTVRNAFVIGSLFTFAAVAIAQEDDNRSERPYYGYSLNLLRLLTKPGVQKELGLGESESQKLMESLRAIDPTNRAFQTPEERQQRITARSDEIKQKCEAAIKKALREEQFRRFQQLDLQHLGGRALFVPETAQRLALTPEQQKRLETIKENFLFLRRASLSTLTPGTLPKPNEELSEKYNADLLAVLTPEQTNQWKALTGAPFKAPKFSLRGPLWGLVEVPEVQKELGLSENDAAALLKSLEAIRTEVHRESSRADNAAHPYADQVRRFPQIIELVRSSLTLSQWNRLQELILQQTGIESLAHHEVAKKLGLTKEQRDRVRKATDEFQQGMTADRTGPEKPKGYLSLRRKEQADLLDILTPDQKKQWEAMMGKKVDPAVLGILRIPPAGE